MDRMDENEALSLARKTIRDNGIIAGVPKRIEYHREGGKSLENVHRIPDYTSILNTPYYEIHFSGAAEVALNSLYMEESFLIVVVFENNRVLVVPGPWMGLTYGVISI